MVAITHTTQVNTTTFPDNPAFAVQPGDWNDPHTINFGVSALTDGTTVNTDATTYHFFTLLIQGTGRTLANPTNLKTGATYIWVITQDGTGSRTITAYGNLFSWPGGTMPTLSTAAGAVDVITAGYDGVKLRAVINKAFA